mmetsp:Transcript_130095/g.224891  ORF Transcript_130095/g.224891 Transcript_130095/m.224891 type:complete len:240 (+) Transcript_130095:1513-2232(+)
MARCTWMPSRSARRSWSLGAGTSVQTARTWWGCCSAKITLSGCKIGSPSNRTPGSPTWIGTRCTPRGCQCLRYLANPSTPGHRTTPSPSTPHPMMDPSTRHSHGGSPTPCGPHTPHATCEWSRATPNLESPHDPGPGSAPCPTHPLTTSPGYLTDTLGFAPSPRPPQPCTPLKSQWLPFPFPRVVAALPPYLFASSRSSTRACVHACAVDTTSPPLVSCWLGVNWEPTNVDLAHPDPTT